MIKKKVGIISIIYEKLEFIKIRKVKILWWLFIILGI